MSSLSREDIFFFAFSNVGISNFQNFEFSKITGSLKAATTSLLVCISCSNP